MPDSKPVAGQVVIAVDKRGSLVPYATAYTDEQITEQLENCRERYGAAVVLKERPA